MAAELPTRQQLEQLSKEKGHKALVWYAWRNALRVLPLLGRVPLTKIWSKDTLKHSIAICRIPIVFSQYNDDISKLNNIDARAVYTNADAAIVAIATTRATTRAAAAARATTRAAATYVTASDAYTYVFYADATADADAAAADTAAAAADTSAYAATADAIADSDVYSKAVTYATSDYNFLKQLNTPLKDYWFSHDLWFAKPKWYQKKKKKKSNKPLNFDKDCQLLSDQLNQLGLGFMAKDLNRLWRNEANPIQAHWKNYAKPLSSENFKSAASFKAVIFGQARQINAVRVLLLGAGGAGKTTLAQRLKSTNISKPTTATIGIDYLEHQALDLHSKNSAFSGLTIPKNLQLYLWDFGGQTLFHGLHKSFLHENCVYVLVVDNRHEQAPDEWLQQINHLIDGKQQGLPILIVSNEYENCQKQQNEQRLRREYPQFSLHFFYFSCYQGSDTKKHNNSKDSYQDSDAATNNKAKEGLFNFKQQLLETAAQSRYLIAQALFDSADYIDNIFKQETVIERLALEDQLETYLTAQQNNTAKEIDILISQLEGLGRVINISKSINNNRYCLNPHWVLDHAYHLLYLKSLRNSNGTIERRQLERDAWRYFSTHQHAQAEKSTTKQPQLNYSNIDDLLNFLQQSRVCKALCHNDLLFFPDLASANEPPRVQDYLQKKTVSSVVELHLPYLPISLAAHLVCRWLENQDDSQVIIKSIDDVWCEGFILRHQQDEQDEESFLIVQYQSRKATLLLHCFAIDSKLLQLLTAIWNGLIAEIKPITAEQIRVFIGIERGISTLYPHHNNTQTTTNSIEQAVIQLFNELRKDMGKQNTTTINTNGGTLQVNTGDNVTMTQHNNKTEQVITTENRAEFVLKALQIIYQEKKLSAQQRAKLSALELQLENNSADESIYTDLNIQLGTAANIATISTSIAAMFGLA